MFVFSKLSPILIADVSIRIWPCKARKLGAESRCTPASTRGVVCLPLRRLPIAVFTVRAFPKFAFEGRNERPRQPQIP